MKDDRFSTLFTNPDFAIDTQSREYKMVHHNVSKLDEKAKKKQTLMAEKFAEVDETEPVKAKSKSKVRLKHACERLLRTAKTCLILILAKFIHTPPS